jgi:hypothetical protein
MNTTKSIHTSVIVPENHAGAVPIAAAAEPMDELTEESSAHAVDEAQEDRHG